MEPLNARIGYKFRNPLLLAEALTHPSLAYETQRPHFDNQRLEFLGDAVLQVIFTHELFQRFSTFGEGTLTKLRSRLVSRTALAAYAERIQLGQHLLMGRGEESSGGRQRPSTLSDAFEALIGATYLDGGLDSAKNVVMHICTEDLDRISLAPVENNPKGQLQELLQAMSNASPHYVIVSQEGPDHRKTFEARVDWNGRTLAHGRGNSKKEAETAAAVAALQCETVVALTAAGEDGGKPGGKPMDCAPGTSGQNGGSRKVS